MTPLFAVLMIAICPAEAGDNRDYELLSSTEVIRRASNNDSHAVAELGERREKSAIPLLRKIRAQSVPANPIAYSTVTAGMSAEDKIRILSKADRRDSIMFSQEAALIALAKLGDKESLDIIFQRLRSEDQQVVSQAIFDAGSSGNKRAVKHLIPFLKPSDWKEMRGPHPTTIPHWDSAEQALCINQPETCKKLDAKRKETGKDLRDLWLKWWGENQKDFVN